MNSAAKSQFEILRRIYERGRDYFAEKKETYGVDLFKHIKNETMLLEKCLQENCIEQDAKRLAFLRYQYLKENRCRKFHCDPAKEILAFNKMLDDDMEALKFKWGEGVVE